MKTPRSLLATLCIALGLFASVYGCHKGSSAGGMYERRGPPGSAAPPQELWFFGRVVENDGFAASRGPGGGGAPAREDVPGCGAIVAQDPAGGGTVPLPLEHTDVKAQVRGAFSTVELEQRFKNPFDTKIEAVYVFPLPADAAVHDFVMTFGDRTIRGIVRERAEAERMYAEARAQGYVASLLTEERP